MGTFFVTLSGSGVPSDVATEAFGYAVRSLRATGGSVGGSVGGSEDDGSAWSVNASDITDDTGAETNTVEPETIAAADDTADAVSDASITDDAAEETPVDPSTIVATEPVVYDAADTSNTGPTE